MFCNDLREKHEENVNLKGLDADTMSILLEYTYTSKVTITKDNVQKMLEAASLFQVCTNIFSHMNANRTSSMVQYNSCKV